MGESVNMGQWVARKESRFLRKLEELERKWDKASAEKRANHPFPYEPKTSFVGFGMCEIASAALAWGVKSKFGDEVDVTGVFRKVPNLDYGHMVVRAGYQSESHTLDATHRQIFSHLPAKIMIIPTHEEDAFYKGGRIFKHLSFHELMSKVTNDIHGGAYSGLALGDFQQLARTLR